MKDTSKRLNIALLMAMDAQNKRTWSGTTYHIARMLQKYIGDVTYISPIHCAEQKLARLLHRSSRLLLKKNFTTYHSFLLAKKYAKIASQKLAQQPIDIIVAPAGATEIAFLKTNIPIVLIEDATYDLLIDSYPEYSNLHPRCAYELHTLETLALKNASVIISSSEWAARSVREDYHVDPKKVHIVPFGANFEHPPQKEIIKERKTSDCCKLLFVGARWQRKGGDIAFETLLKLEEMGIQAELTICGCVPPTTFSHKKMKVIPFLDKNDEHQCRELERLYLNSDFLLLPTRNECFGIVFCEANAYGLPAVTTAIGGVPEIVHNEENGFVLPLSARGAEYAEVIAKVYCDELRYATLVRTSRAAFDSRLNWDAWGIAMRQILTELRISAVPTPRR